MDSIIAYDADWQLPARTEKYVYECLKKDHAIMSGATYFAFPWASLIDGLSRETELGDRLLKELNKLIPELRRNSNRRIITACQHIRFKEYHTLFILAGITDLFASHKEKRQSNLGGINLYPLQLFPVQATNEASEELNIDSKAIPFESRTYDYSFVGAFDSSCYLTNSRRYIFDHLKHRNSAITKRASWHYQARVYDEQVYNIQLSAEHLTEEQKNAKEYINIIKSSKFTLCPSGSGPNSIRLWEAIELDSIPVILADTLDLPGDKELWQRACVFISENENEIKDIPKKLSRIINDKKAYKEKLVYLRKLKQDFGLNNFTAHMVDKIKTINKTHEDEEIHYIIVNCKDLSNNEISEWRRLLNQISSVTTINLDIKLINSASEYANQGKYFSDSRKHETFDFSKDFAVIFDSKTLSENLLTSVKTIYIQPNKSPEYINPSLYPSINNVQESVFKKWVPECTVITSMFNGDEYKAEFINNLQSFDNIENLEIMICRPESKGCEHFDLLDLGRKNTSLTYLWKAKDPGLYDVWNYVVTLSSSPYCTNANIDDKRAPEHITALVNKLNNNPECSVGSTSLRVTDTKGQTWEDSHNEMVWYKPCHPETYGVNKLYKFDADLKKIVSHNIPHCMPVWRTTLHRKHGQFDESRFGPSSDWEFWLRCGLASEKFYLLNKDLGLYYRAPQSYWRRNTSAKSHDDLISLEYFNEHTLRKITLTSKVKSIKFNQLVSALKAGNLWIGISLLYCMISNDLEKSNQEKRLLKYLCDRYLYSNFENLEAAAARLKPVANIKDTFYDFIGFFLRGIDCNNSNEKFKGRLIQLSNLIGTAESELIGFIIKAKIYSIIGRSDLEKTYLKSAYLSDNYGFWCNINRLYGLEEPLEYFLKSLIDINEVPQISNFWWLKKNTTLHFLPDYSHGNPYQQLLYKSFGSSGITTTGIAEKDCLDLDITKFDKGDVLHIHWINSLFKAQTEDTIKATLNSFLNTVTKLKGRGVKIVWTVHNRQNHETLDLEAEHSFRNKLSAICDVVLLHHPMIKNEISEWLDPRANIEIVEHGLYGNIYTNDTDRRESRKALGVSSDSFVMSTLGQIREYKNLTEKIHSIDKAAMKGLKNVTYLIAGKVSCRKTLEAIEETKYADIRLSNEYITGDKIQLYFNSSDIMLLSYKDILTSGSFFQAATFDIFVLAPNLGSLQYYIADSINGYTYSDTDELTEILERSKTITVENKVKSSFSGWPTPRTSVTLRK